MKTSTYATIALAALTLSAALSQAFLFRQEVQQRTHHAREVSTQLGGFVAIDEVPPSPSEIRGLETEDMVRRVYSNGSYPIELVVAYIAKSSRKSAHAQEACLRGAGAEVGGIEAVQLDSLPVKGKLIRLQMHNRGQWVLYFYKIGNIYTADYLKSSWLMFFGGLAGRSGQGASLIRLLTPALNGETPEQALKRFQAFSIPLIPDLEQKLP